MKKNNNMERRTMLKTVGASLGLAATSCIASESNAKGQVSDSLCFRNEDFYQQGEFDLEAAKDAYIELMRFHKYPVFEGIRDQLWISDYGIGEFATVGLGAILFFNRESEEPGDRYTLLDIYLLPNQMLPEHYHVETSYARAKVEAWVVRHGRADIVGEGEETPGLKERVPESQREHGTVWHAVDAGPGEKAELNRPTARHWFLAGPEGVILSEVANYHDNDGVRHSNPNLVFP